MRDGEDWRLTNQEAYLKGAVLVKAQYAAGSDRWDHDHCEFCWAKFSGADGDLRQGYRTKDGSRWICETCYEDFKEKFHFRLEDGRG